MLRAHSTRFLSLQGPKSYGINFKGKSSFTYYIYQMKEIKVAQAVVDLLNK